MSKFQRVQLGVLAKAAALTQINVPVPSLMGETFLMLTLMMAGESLFISLYDLCVLFATEVCNERSRQIVYSTAIAI